MSSGDMTKIAEAVRESGSSVFETDVTWMFIRSSMLRSVRSVDFCCDHPGSGAIPKSVRLKTDLSILEQSTTRKERSIYLKSSFQNNPLPARSLQFLAAWRSGCVPNRTRDNNVSFRITRDVKTARIGNPRYKS